jgi:hypothetical protein
MKLPRVQTVVSSIVGILAIAFYAAILSFPSRAVFFSLSLIWTAFFFFIVRRLSRRMEDRLFHIALSIATMLACLALLALADWRPLQWFAVALAGCAACVLSWMSMEQAHSEGVVHEWKELRRLKMMLITFDAGIAATALFAISLFFPAVPFWILNFLGGVAYAAAAFFVWRLYYNTEFRAHAPWMLLFLIAMIECVWAVHLLPFGYFVSGMLVTWLWYVLQLLARFHFAAQGIIWKNQRWFLAVNAAAYIAVLLYIVRWV